MNFTREALTAEGFAGWVPFAALPRADVPLQPGVYVVTRETDNPPEFLPSSPAGRFQGKDPTVPVERLQAKWVSGATVVYIGKAAIGSRDSRGLSRRLDEYRRFGDGQSIGHRGGRYIWQLADSADLLVAWRTTSAPEVTESAMLEAFVAIYGRLPFANLRR